MEDYGAATLRPNTLRSYEQFIRCYIKPYLGDKIVSRVTRMDIQKLYRKLKHEGRVHGHPEHGHELSDTMVLRIHAMLHQCLKDAEAAHVVARNPTDGAVVPKASYKPKQILTKEQMDTFLAAVDRNEIWRDFFYTELTTGLRRGELLALQWDDLDFKTGTLTVNKQVYEVKGRLQVSVPKTRASIRRLVLPPGVVEVLRQYRETVDSRWMFPSPVKEDMPMTPGAVRRRLQIILERAGCKRIRFHDLRHTFATLSLESGMDVKTLSAMLGHVSAATTLDIYTHVTGDMQTEAAAKIDRGLGNEVQESPAQTEQSSVEDFQPVLGRKRKSGSGCITQINDHLFEGRYSPTWPDGTKHSKCVYAHTREECEAKLKTLIREMQAERKLLLDQMRGITPPDKLTKKQKQIWQYLRFHPDETNLSVIARGAGVNRHTVAKWYEMIRGMVGIQKT